MARRTESGTEDDGAQVKARVLVRTQVEGVWYEPNSIVSASASVIKALDQGSIDSSDEAVAYAESLIPKVGTEA